MTVSNNGGAATSPSWRGDGLTTGPGHFVQFYEEQDFLFTAVSDFLADGLMSNEPVLVIATPEHRQGFIEGLQSRGFLLDGDSNDCILTFLDARETLATFMAGNMPDEGKFQQRVGALMEASTRGRTGLLVRAYGEMVDLLWRDGNPEAALRLEELWTELAARKSISLLCAYRMGNFYKETATGDFENICRHHDRVLPAESYPGVVDDERARQISLLQQRAGALAAEIEHRRELETALREALAARRNAEEALRRSERELRDFIDNATIGLHWVGPDGRILWANEAELKLLGYSRSEYIGRHIADFYEDPSEIEDILRRLRANEELRDYEARMVARDGSIRHVAISSNALIENGRIVRTRCFTRDITDSKRIDQENAFLLEASTVLNRSLDYDAKLRELATLIVPRLADWCAIDIATDATLYERATTAHADSTRTNDIPTPHPLAANDPVRSVLTTGRRQLFADLDQIAAAYAFDGEQLHDLTRLETRCQMIVPMTLNGRHLGAITLAMSESGRTFAQTDLALATELARRAAVALENAHLYHLAQTANRTKDEFLATLSHELRTPLTAILGWARLLTMGGLDAETSRTAFETIERSARTQTSLIDDLLDLSRIVTGKLTLQSDLVDLPSVIDSALQTVRLAAEAKNIQFEIGGLSERAIVTGDATRLQQIAWNLISNAIKFSPAGGSISVRLLRSADHARIVVQDKGAGIAPEFLPHVFEPFRQGDGGSTRNHGGLGLGLAIVKYLAELHGGSVAASSEGPGCGAAFIVTLPLASRKAQPVQPHIEDEIVDLAGTSILLVDDDADTRDLVTAVLRRCGAEVTSAESVSLAREKVSGKRPDVVVSDIAMPDQDGYALLRHLRETDDAARPIAVVALTAMSDPASEDRLRAAGFQACVRKPLDPIEFARIIAGLR
jgi:PAS domain S-box-containing protein